MLFKNVEKGQEIKSILLKYSFFFLRKLDKKSMKKKEI